jgi:acyl-CoA reductase-like NAD-dependent aldehyde dehydrogenase
MKAYVAGEWVGSDVAITVRSPFSGNVVDTVPEATSDEVSRALGAAAEGAESMRAVPAHERSSILARAAHLIEADVDDLARTITAEQGKYTVEAEAEASRIAGIVRLCAEEARRLYGETLPMDAAPVGVGRLGYTRPEPAGVVVAITPFNYPAILVIHKIGPALAAGNAVILKPASATPLTSLFLVERLMQAGLPQLALQCLVGPGSTICEALVSDRRVRKISFTGSYAVGEAIAKAAGLKRLTCELGSNAAFIVLEDADLDRVAEALAFAGYTNSGQNCVSAQRVLVHERLRDELVERLTEKVDRLVPGDPADPRTTLAPLITERAADRVVRWLAEARERGAILVRGGDRDRSLVEPAVVVDPPPRLAHVA